MIKHTMNSCPVPSASPPSPLGIPMGDGGEAGGRGREVMLMVLIMLGYATCRNHFGNKKAKKVIIKHDSGKLKECPKNNAKVGKKKFHEKR